MEHILINHSREEGARVAVCTNQTLTDLDIAHTGQDFEKGNIYKVRVTRVEASLDAAFVEYGNERQGFLPLKDIARELFVVPPPEGATGRIQIQNTIQEGQEFLAQVEKEQRGTKGAAMTSFISLAGAYLVLMPNNPRAGGISRRIEGGERDDLRESIAQLNLPENMSVIVRTAGVDKSSEELQADLDMLLAQWTAIVDASGNCHAPQLIHCESDVIIRAMRDYLRAETDEILVDDLEAHARIKSYLERVRPDAVEKLKYYESSIPLFNRYHIEQQIELTFKREVRLPSGGAIVIDITEALISIDINSARATKGGNIEETALNTNLEAADEIARQLRLRDIGGLIVIDFIDMVSVKNQRTTEERLRTAVKRDRARIQITRISRFGLLEMSRQRLRSSFSESTRIECPRCSGRGTIRSVEALSMSIIHAIEEAAITLKTRQVHAQVPVDVATYLLNEKRLTITNIEAQHNIHLIIVPNQYLESPHYKIKTIQATESHTSHTLAEMPQGAADVDYQSSRSKKSAQPAVKQNLARKATASKSESGLIKRLWTQMFGATDTPPKKRSTSGRKPQQRSRAPQNKRRGGGSGGKTQQTRGQYRYQAKGKGQGQKQSGTQSKPRSGNRAPSQRRSNTTRSSEAKATGNTARSGESKATSSSRNPNTRTRQPASQKTATAPSTDKKTDGDKNGNV